MTEEEQKRLDTLESELRRARDDAAKYRTERSSESEELKAKLKAFEDAERKRSEDEAKAKGDYEKVIAEKEKALAERDLELKARDKREAALKGNFKKKLLDAAIDAQLADAVDPDVRKIFDAKGVEIDDETFEIKGLEDSVKAFREAKPHFFKDGAQSGNDARSQSGGRTPSKSNDGGNTSRDWSKLSPEEYEKAMQATFGMSA